MCKKHMEVKMLLRPLLIIVAAVLLTACARPGEHREDLSSLVETAPLLTAPQVPGRIAVQDRASFQPGSSVAIHVTGSRNGEAAVTLLEAVQHVDVGLADITVLSREMIRSESRQKDLSEFDAARVIAARQGYDYLAFADRYAGSEISDTPLSVLNVTLVGAFVLPAQRFEGEVGFVVNIVDVETGLTVTDEHAFATTAAFVPLWGGHSTRSFRLKRAEREAAEALVLELDRQIEAAARTMEVTAARTEPPHL
jgi:hypothetical protein